jgi:hypothetical protein
MKYSNNFFLSLETPLDNTKRHFTHSKRWRTEEKSPTEAAVRSKLSTLGNARSGTWKPLEMLPHTTARFHSVSLTPLEVAAAAAAAAAKANKAE